MKRISLTLAVLMLAVSVLFAGCRGKDDGKVSDDNNSGVDITTTANLSNTREDITDMITSASEFLSPGTSSSAATSDNVTR